MNDLPPTEIVVKLGDEFRILGLSLAKKPTAGSIQRQDRHFRSFFGASWTVCAEAWVRIYPELSNGNKFLRKKHLLWALLFLKLYSTESIHAGLVGCDEKTFSKWVWKVVAALADLDVELVSLKGRNKSKNSKFSHLFYCFFDVPSLSLNFCAHLFHFCFRFVFKTGTKMIKAMIAFSLLIVVILKLRNHILMKGNGPKFGTLTNLRVQALDMRLHFAFSLGTSVGSMGLSPVEQKMIGQFLKVNCFII